MDISQTIPLLIKRSAGCEMNKVQRTLANIVRFLLSNRAKEGKIYVLILSLAIGLTGILLFFEFGVSAAEADFIGEILICQEQTSGLIIFQGNALAAASNPSDEDGKQVRKVKVVVTAYSSTPWETDSDPYITASGNLVRDGIVAINSLPFGTQIRMPEVFGDKVFTVEDRMNWRKGNYHVDIWFPSYWEALNFGAKRTYIEVLEG